MFDLCCEYLYSAFDCMLISCHILVSEWIYTRWLPGFRETSCLKQARYLNFKWQNGIWTHIHLVRKRTLNHFLKLAKWLSYVVSSYLYGEFDCMLLYKPVRVGNFGVTVILNVKVPVIEIKHYHLDYTWKTSQIILRNLIRKSDLIRFN